MRSIAIASGLSLERDAWWPSPAEFAQAHPKPRRAHAASNETESSPALLLHRSRQNHVMPATSIAIDRATTHFGRSVSIKVRMDDCPFLPLLARWRKATSALDISFNNAAVGASGRTPSLPPKDDRYGRLSSTRSVQRITKRSRHCPTGTRTLRSRHEFEN